MNKKKIFKRVVAVVMSLTLVITSIVIPRQTTDVSAGTNSLSFETDDFSVEKISNPYRGAGEVDGLIPGGDRNNSYAWCMTERDGKIYIGTNRGLGSNMFGNIVKKIQALGLAEEMAIALADMLTNSDFEHEKATTGGDIIVYNTKTGKMKVLKTGEVGVSFRMAITHGDDVFFGSYNNVQNSIYRIDKDDNIEEVYSTESGVSMRAACEYQDSLYFGGVDSTEELDEGYEDAAKLAVLKMDNKNPSKWDRVADYKDFDLKYTTDPSVKSTIASPIWDIVEYDGYIYATLPNCAGFVMYKGHPAAGSETANEYGWYWEEVIGCNNGINNTGLAPDRDGYTDYKKNLLSNAATPFVFKGKLYLMDFDNTLESMMSTLDNLVGFLFLEKGELLKKMYTTLSHPQSLWVMNDDGKFEKVQNFSKLMKGTCNEYLWRTAEYDGELYITTMDASVVYRYLTQYTDLRLEKDNLKDKTKIIINIATLMKMFGLDESENEKIKTIANLVIQLADILKMASENLSEAQINKLNEKYKDFASKFVKIITEFISKLGDKDVAKDIAEDIATGNAKDNDTVKLLAALEGKSTVNNVVKQLKEGDDPSGNEPTTLLDETTTVVDETTTVAEETTTVADETQSVETTAEETTKSDWEDLQELIKLIVENIRKMAEEAKSYIESLVNKVVNIIKQVDWETVYMYTYISNRVNSETKGFDMYKTADGVNFEVVTKDGFGDRYNYGGRTLQPTKDGLYVGTSNPFNGAQLFLLTNKSKEVETTTSAPVVPTTTKVSPTSAPTPTPKKKTDKNTVTVKKNKTVKVTFKVAKSKKNKKVRVLRGKKARKFAKISKIATVKKVVIKNGKIIVTLKAKKKGKGKLKIKVSKKKKASKKIIVK